jgi:cellobiose-specific phosphotransferase system component IIC
MLEMWYVLAWNYEPGDLWVFGLFWLWVIGLTGASIVLPIFKVIFFRNSQEASAQQEKVVSQADEENEGNFMNNIYVWIGVSILIPILLFFYLPPVYSIMIPITVFLTGFVLELGKLKRNVAR